MRAVRDERGALGGLEGLAFGVLIFAFGTLLVVNAWAMVDGKLAAITAAREAARAYVEAADRTSADAAAQAAAIDVVGGYSRESVTVTVTSLDGNAGYSRCDPIRATAVVHVPRISLPLLGAAGGTQAVTGTHDEVVDPYRSGLPGTANCVI